MNARKTLILVAAAAALAAPAAGARSLPTTVPLAKQKRAKAAVVRTQPLYVASMVIRVAARRD